MTANAGIASQLRYAVHVFRPGVADLWTFGEEIMMDPEKRAPGWQLRCTRCGFTEPWGKYGIRVGALSWKKYTIGRCASCKRFGFHAIERHPESVGKKE